MLDRKQKESPLPEFINVTPTVILYENEKHEDIQVNLTNLTTNTITLSP